MAPIVRFTAPALIALLAACGDSAPVDLNTADGSADFTMKDGTEIATATNGKGMAPPENLPDFAPIYPGGRVQQVMVNDRSPGNGVVSFRAKASIEEVARYYIGKGSSAGLELKTDDAPSPVTRTLMFAKSQAPGKDIGFQANISQSFPEDGSVIVALTYVGPG